jgi:Ceramidase
MEVTRRLDWRSGVLGAVAFAGIVVAVLMPRIPQDPGYHAFVDVRTIAGVRNFWNVLSNAPFVFAGVYGLLRTREIPAGLLKVMYVTFCVGAVAVAFGSGWYHHAPSTPALVWDRLPMSIAFMALFAALLGERVSWRLARALFAPLLILGVASVFYWAWTEQHGAGDLRPYAVVQFLPMLLMPLMLLICPGGAGVARWLWWTFALYVAAKLCEQLDAPIYRALGLSGHSIKHVLGAVAVLCAIFALLRMESPPPRAARARTT